MFASRGRSNRSWTRCTYIRITYNTPPPPRPRAVHPHQRFLLESIRPEIRQYFIESDSESVPFSRAHRSVVYARAKGTSDTLPFGTRRDVYQARRTCMPRSARS